MVSIWLWGLAFAMLGSTTAAWGQQRVSAPFEPSLSRAEVQTEAQNGISRVATRAIPVGRGFNTLSAEFRGDCLRGTVTDSNSAGMTTKFSLRRASTSEELRQATGMSAAASAGVGIWKGDTSANFYSSLQRNSFTDHLVVNVRVSGPTVEFAPIGVVRPDETPFSFYTRCGNKFVRSVTLGGEFTAVVSIESQTEDERRDTQANLQAVAAGSGSGSAAFQSTLSRLSKQSSIKVSILRDGTNDVIPALDMEKMIDYAVKFPDKINADNARPVDYELVDYQTIDVNFLRYHAEEAVAEAWANAVGNLYVMRADIDYYSRNKGLEFYPPLSDEGVEAGINSVSAALFEARAQYIKCAENPATECARLTPPTVNLRIPRRAKQIWLNAQTGSPQTVGVVGDRESKSLVVLGAWSAWASGEDLWWLPEHCCFSVVITQEGQPTREVGYSGPLRVQGPAVVSVRISDSHHGDNRNRELRAILY